MKTHFILAFFSFFLFLGCSSGKSENIYPDSGENAKTDTELTIDDDLENQDETKDTDENNETDIQDDSENEYLTDSDTEESDSDMIIINTDPCIPNPCIMENSDGTCTTQDGAYVCGCKDDYYWYKFDCVADPCADDPCSTIFHSTGECSTGDGSFICTCEPSYYWKDHQCHLTPDIVYVKADADGLNDGTSWENAYTNFEVAMLSLGNDVTEEKWVWVSKGVYKPKNDVTGTTCETAEKEFSFSLKNNVSVFGGFAGNETDISQRDWKTNKTIFSGDTDNSGDISECDVYHVFYNYNIDNTAVLDGVIIENGNANCPDSDTQDKHTKHGGGMNNWGYADPTIRNVTFRNNSAEVNGGGLSNSYGSNPTIENCTFENNEASKGGAFSAANESNPVITNSVFKNNKTRDGYGGAILIDDSNPYFYNCLFTENESEDGGAAVITEGSFPIIENCRFSNNTATRNGGALGIGGSSNKPKIKNCIFESNTALKGGGAIEVYSGSVPSIINSTFYRNEVVNGTTLTTGGAVLVSEAEPYFINSLFLNNSASAGGAISNKNGSPIFLNCTIVYNSAGGEFGYGGGMYSETGSAPVLINTIMWYNQALNYDPEIHNNFATPVINNSDISGSFTDGTWDDAFGTDHGNNINSDPDFNNPDIADFTLSFFSPCINSGDNSPYEEAGIAASIVNDFLGNDRIIDGTVDMGAYESNYDR